MLFLKKNKYKLLTLGAILIIAAGSIIITHPKKAHLSCTHFGRISIAPDTVIGSIVTLKKLKDEFFIDYHNMFSNIVRHQFESPKHITLDYTIRSLRTRMRDCDSGKTLYYCIFDNKEDTLIGGIEIREKNELDNGQLGCWLNEHYWGGGRIQEALKLITTTYFALHPKEKNCIAHVRLWNKRSYNALKKFGFKEISLFYEDNKPTRYVLEYAKPA